MIVPVLDAIYEICSQDADDVLHRMMEDVGSSTKNLHGHGGPVYGLSFSPGVLGTYFFKLDLRSGNYHSLRVRRTLRG